MLGMTQTDPGGFHHTLLGEGVGCAVKDQEWLTAFFLMHVDIAPAHRFSNAGAKCFGHCFLGRESGRKMARGKFHRHAVSNFALGKNPFHETFAKTIERVLNALDLDHVHANAEHAHPVYFSMSASISRTAFSQPTKIARETMACPMLSSVKCGIL